MAPISLTLNFDTAAQAHHVLEAYREAMGLGTPQPADTTATSAATTARQASERAAGILPQTFARDLPDGGTSKMYPTNPDGSIAVHPASPQGNGTLAPPVTAAGNVVTAPNSTALAGASGNLDARGVPHNPQFHGENKTADGNWKRKRGHDKAAADAWEAGFLQPAGATPAPTAAALPAGSYPQSPASAAPTAAVNLPPAPTAPVLPAASAPEPVSPADYQAKWIELCKTGRVTTVHQQQIEQMFGAHPLAPAIIENVQARVRIYDAFRQWDAGNSGWTV